MDFRKRLNAAQYEAATCGDGPVLVVAGAGSGKTRTIVHRLAWLADQGVSPASMLLLTFTRKAAHEMLQRAADVGDQGLIGVQGGTFHSFAFGVLRRWRPEWLEGRAFSLMDGADIAAAVKECRETLGIGKGDRSFPRTQAVVGLLSKARNKEQGMDVILQREACQLLPHAEALTRLGEAYTAYRRERVAVLIKPQFELGPGETVKGVVRDEAARRRAVDKITTFCDAALGLTCEGVVPAAVKGPKGNQEYMALFSRRGEARPDASVSAPPCRDA